MNIIIQFLKTAGIGHPKSPGKSRRDENRKRWKEEKDKKEKHHGHPNHHHHYDNHHDHNDWTY